MKNLITALFSVFVLTFAADAQVSVNDGRIEAVVTSETSREQLAQMAEELRTHGLEMRYDRIQWDENWNLTHINLRVKGDNTEIKAFMTEEMSAIGEIRVVFKTEENALCVGPDCE